MTLANTTLTLVTPRDRSSWNGPVLAIYPNRKLLDKVDAFGASDEEVEEMLGEGVDVEVQEDDQTSET